MTDLRSSEIKKVSFLLSDAEKLEGLKEKHEKCVSSSNIDKYGYEFMPATRTSVFSANVSLEMYHGSYGSSSVYVSETLSDRDAVRIAFMEVLNNHRDLLVLETAKILRRKAKEKSSTAREQLKKLSEMLDRAEGGRS